MAALYEVKGNMSDEMIEFFKEKVDGKDKRTLMVLNLYIKSKDVSDTVNSLERYFKKTKK